MCESLMKLLRTTALTAALVTAAVPSLTTPANAWGWGWGVYRITAISATQLITAMVSPTRLMAMVMGAATTAVTDTPITRSGVTATVRSVICHCPFSWRRASDLLGIEGRCEGRSSNLLETQRPLSAAFLF
jgi:hypothetical protein